MAYTYKPYKHELKPAEVKARAEKELIELSNHLPMRSSEFVRNLSYRLWSADVKIEGGKLRGIFRRGEEALRIYDELYISIRVGRVKLTAILHNAILTDEADGWILHYATPFVYEVG